MLLLLALICGGLIAFVALGVILALAVTSSNQPPYVKKSQNISKAQATTKKLQLHTNNSNNQQSNTKVSNQNSKQSSN